MTIALHQQLDQDVFRQHLERLGYGFEDEADQVGEAAFRDAVIDLVPVGDTPPVRIRVDEGMVVEIDRLDPATRRSQGTIDSVTIGPASEVVTRAGDARPPGLEHRLPDYAGSLTSVFDLMPEATLLMDLQSDERMLEALEQISEARATRVALCRAIGAALPPDDFYLTSDDWASVCSGREVRTVEWPEADAPPARPTLSTSAERYEAAIRPLTTKGIRVGLSGARLARALGVEAEDVGDWPGLLAMEPGAMGVLPSGLNLGFVTPDAAVFAWGDVMPPRRGDAGHEGLFDIQLRPGDAVIHLDYGMARLDGIETVDAGGEVDTVCLSFSDDARKLVPAADMDRIWRYGSTGDVAFDRADGTTWVRRRAAVLADLSATAETLVRAARARESLKAPRIQPPPRRMDRFVAGFPYAATPDQQAAFDAIAADLAAGTPMDRLLCGDVGFGKTEAALRAAAAVALSGRQAAVLAPTTVLVRQHLSTFRRRFAAIGIEVAAISRLTPPAEASSIRERLAAGDLLVVIGTQALARKDTVFAKLALLIVDEEQRFGTWRNRGRRLGL